MGVGTREDGGHAEGDEERIVVVATPGRVRERTRGPGCPQPPEVGLSAWSCSSCNQYTLQVGSTLLYNAARLLLQHLRPSVSAGTADLAPHDEAPSPLHPPPGPSTPAPKP